MKRLELVEGASSKFWEVDVAGKDLTVRFGRIGTNGQLKTKSFPSQEAAEKERDKLVKEKTGKGYVEAGVVPGAKLPVTPTVPSPELASSEIHDSGSVGVPSASVATKSSLPDNNPASQPIQVPRAEPVLTAQMAWPQGGFQWTDELRQKCPFVRGIFVPTVPDLDTLLARPITFGDNVHQYARDRIVELAQSAGRHWQAWDAARCTEALSLASLRRPDAEFWLELCVQVLHLPVKFAGGSNFIGDFFGQVGLHWVVHVGCTLHGIPFMLDVLFTLSHIVAGPNQTQPRALAPILLPLREAIAASADAQHEEVLAWLSEQANDTAQDRLVRAYLCPHKTEWAQACVIEGDQGIYQLVKECVLPIEQANELFSKLPTYGYLLRAGVLLQIHLHDEAAFDLLADLVRRTDDKATRGEWLDLAMRMQTPRLLELLVELFDRNEVRLALEKLSERYAAALLLTLVPRALATRSRAMQGWAVRLGLREPEALRQALAEVTAQERATFETLVGSLQEDEADLDQLPSLLREPPWLGKARAVPLPTLNVPVKELPSRIEWDEVQRTRYQAYAVNKWIAKRVSESDPDRYLLNELQISPEAQPRVLAGEPVQAQDVVLTRRYYSGQPVDMALLLSPKVALPFWNSYPGQYWYAWGDPVGAVKAMLARYGEAAIPGLALYVQSHAEEGLLAAMEVDAPCLVPYVLHALRNLKKAKPLAIQWLRAHPVTVATVALPMAFTKEKASRDNAQFALRWLCANGFEDQTRSAATGYGSEMTQALQALLDVDPLLVLPSRMPKLPGFFVAPSLRRPVLVSSGNALPPSAVEHIGSMLAISKLEAPYAGLERVRELCTATSLAEFAWDLFEAWQLAGAPSKEGWAFIALGLLGNDETARRLAPRIREWPGEGSHQRAVTGLDLLAAIGTDAALMYLNGIASKVKFKALQDRAREKIAAVAEVRGFTAAELADRLVPDLGLDERGALCLDFGARQFHVAFDENLKPQVKDASGVRLKDLPKPNKTDDAEKAEVATERYKQLKKDAKATASLQVTRLELAMIDRRRWSAQDFKMFFLDHPLMRHLAARLVWGVYDAQGQLLSAYRVAEDWTLADGDDELYTLPDTATVGIAHVLEMPAAVQTSFGQIFADYEILQPFKQLGRETYALTDAERQSKEIKRFADKIVATGSVLGLVNRGWERGQAQDGGWVGWFSKRVDENREIELQLEPGLVAGDMSWEPKQSFPAIVMRKVNTWGDEGHLPLLDLDPILASEVLRDIALLAPLKE